MARLGIVAALAGVVVAPAAFAQEGAGARAGYYGNIGLAESAPGGGGAQMQGVQGRFGGRVSKHLGFEAELAREIRDDRAFSSGLRRDAELERQSAAYGVAYLPVSKKADVFARLGYGENKTRFWFGGPGRGESVNYGAGAQYFPNERKGVRADFTRHDFRNAKVKANIVSLGFVRKF